MRAEEKGIVVVANQAISTVVSLVFCRL
jgi:hypothetical protein